MEQQNKYYTPDISELHVGYELEVEDFNQGHENGVQWIKAIIVHGGTIERDTHEQIFDGTAIQGIEARNDVYIRNTYRTKYLDQSDIESCGWKFHSHNNKEVISFNCDYFKHLDHSITCDYIDHKIVIFCHVDETTRYVKYMGECKSINELKKIMQWLNIK